MKIFAVPLLLGLSLVQYAAADSSLNVGHKIPPLPPMDSRCSLSIGQNVIDYGAQSRWQLQDAAIGRNSVTFGKRTLMLSVVCPFTQSMRLMLRAERAARGGVRYGSQGSMTVRLLDAQMDGQAVQVANTSIKGVIKDTLAESQRLSPGETYAPIANGQLTKGKVFTARIEIEPMLPEAEARVSTRQASEAHFALDLLQ